jgi:hypothetical protein
MVDLLVARSAFGRRGVRVIGGRSNKKEMSGAEAPPLLTVIFEF